MLYLVEGDVADADQLAVFKCSREVELKTTSNSASLWSKQGWPLQIKH